MNGSEAADVGVRADDGTGRQSAWLRTFVRDIPGYPRDGVTWRDISPLLADGPAFAHMVDDLAARFEDDAVDTVVGIEARGFVPAAAVAYRLGAAFIPVRKAGKLPWAVVREEYDSVEGPAKLEIHRDAVRPGERLIVVDDVMATGATATATVRLVEALDGVVVGVGVVVELGDLGGRTALGARRLESLAVY